PFPGPQASNSEIVRGERGQRARAGGDRSRNDCLTEEYPELVKLDLAPIVSVPRRDHDPWTARSSCRLLPVTERKSICQNLGAQFVHTVGADLRTLECRAMCGP